MHRKPLEKAAGGQSASLGIWNLGRGCPFLSSKDGWGSTVPSLPEQAPRFVLNTCFLSRSTERGCMLGHRALTRPASHKNPGVVSLVLEEFGDIVKLSSSLTVLGFVPAINLSGDYNYLLSWVPVGNHQFQGCSGRCPNAWAQSKSHAT